MAKRLNITGVEDLDTFYDEFGNVYRTPGDGIEEGGGQRLKQQSKAAGLSQKELVRREQSARNSLDSLISAHGGQFTAKTYGDDDYGRKVADVTAPDGTNVADLVAARGGSAAQLEIDRENRPGFLKRLGLSMGIGSTETPEEEPSPAMKAHERMKGIIAPYSQDIFHRGIDASSISGGTGNTKKMRHETPDFSLDQINRFKYENRDKSGRQADLADYMKWAVDAAFLPKPTTNTTSHNTFNKAWVDLPVMDEHGEYKNERVLRSQDGINGLFDDEILLDWKETNPFDIEGLNQKLGVRDHIKQARSAKQKIEAFAAEYGGNEGVAIRMALDQYNPSVYSTNPTNFEELLEQMKSDHKWRISATNLEYSDNYEKIASKFDEFLGLRNTLDSEKRQTAYEYYYKHLTNNAIERGATPENDDPLNEEEEAALLRGYSYVDPSYVQDNSAVENYIYGGIAQETANIERLLPVPMDSSVSMVPMYDNVDESDLLSMITNPSPNPVYSADPYTQSVYDLVSKARSLAYKSGALYADETGMTINAGLLLPILTEAGEQMRSIVSKRQQDHYLDVARGKGQGLTLPGRVLSLMPPVSMLATELLAPELSKHFPGASKVISDVVDGMYRGDPFSYGAYLYERLGASAERGTLVGYLASRISSLMIPISQISSMLYRGDLAAFGTKSPNSPMVEASSTISHLTQLSMFTPYYIDPKKVQAAVEAGEPIPEGIDPSSTEPQPIGELQFYKDKDGVLQIRAKDIPEELKAFAVSRESLWKGKTIDDFKDEDGIINVNEMPITPELLGHLWTNLFNKIPTMRGVADPETGERTSIKGSNTGADLYGSVDDYVNNTRTNVAMKFIAAQSALNQFFTGDKTWVGPASRSGVAATNTRDAFTNIVGSQRQYQPQTYLEMVNDPKNEAQALQRDWAQQYGQWFAMGGEFVGGPFSGALGATKLIRKLTGTGPAAVAKLTKHLDDQALSLAKAGAITKQLKAHDPNMYQAQRRVVEIMSGTTKLTDQAIDAGLLFAIAGTIRDPGTVTYEEHYQNIKNGILFRWIGDVFGFGLANLATGAHLSRISKTAGQFGFTKPFAKGQKSPLFEELASPRLSGKGDISKSLDMFYYLLAQGPAGVIQEGITRLLVDDDNESWKQLLHNEDHVITASIIQGWLFSFLPMGGRPLVMDIPHYVKAYGESITNLRELGAKVTNEQNLQIEAEMNARQKVFYMDNNIAKANIKQREDNASRREEMEARVHALTDAEGETPVQIIEDRESTTYIYDDGRKVSAQILGYDENGPILQTEELRADGYHTMARIIVENGNIIRKEIFRDPSGAVIDKLPEPINDGTQIGERNAQEVRDATTAEEVAEANHAIESVKSDAVIKEQAEVETVLDDNTFLTEDEQLDADIQFLLGEKVDDDGAIRYKIEKTEEYSVEGELLYTDQELQDQIIWSDGEGKLTRGALERAEALSLIHSIRTTPGLENFDYSALTLYSAKDANGRRISGLFNEGEGTNKGILINVYPHASKKSGIANTFLHELTHYRTSLYGEQFYDNPKVKELYQKVLEAFPEVLQLAQRSQEAGKGENMLMDEVFAYFAEKFAENAPMHAFALALPDRIYAENIALNETIALVKELREIYPEAEAKNFWERTFKQKKSKLERRLDDLHKLQVKVLKMPEGERRSRALMALNNLTQRVKELNREAIRSNMSIFNELNDLLDRTEKNTDEVTPLNQSDMDKIWEAISKESLVRPELVDDYNVVLDESVKVNVKRLNYQFETTGSDPDGTSRDEFSETLADKQLKSGLITAARFLNMNKEEMIANIQSPEHPFHAYPAFRDTFISQIRAHKGHSTLLQLDKAFDIRAEAEARKVWLQAKKMTLTDAVALVITDSGVNIQRVGPLQAINPEYDSFMDKSDMYQYQNGGWDLAQVKADDLAQRAMDMELLRAESLFRSFGGQTKLLPVSSQISRKILKTVVLKDGGIKLVDNNNRPITQHIHIYDEQAKRFSPIPLSRIQQDPGTYSKATLVVLETKGTEKIYDNPAIFDEMASTLIDEGNQAYYPTLHGSNALDMLDVSMIKADFRSLLQDYVGKETLLSINAQEGRELAFDKVEFFEVTELEMLAHSYLSNENVIPGSKRVLRLKEGSVDLAKYMTLTENFYDDGIRVKLPKYVTDVMGPDAIPFIKEFNKLATDILIGTPDKPELFRLSPPMTHIKLSNGKTIREYLKNAGEGKTFADGDLSMINEINKHIAGKIGATIDYMQQIILEPSGDFLRPFDYNNPGSRKKSNTKYSKALFRNYTTYDYKDLVEVLKGTPYEKDGLLNIPNVFVRTNRLGETVASTKSLYVDPAELAKHFPDHFLLNYINEKVLDAGDIVFNEVLADYYAFMDGKAGRPVFKDEVLTDHGSHIKHAAHPTAFDGFSTIDPNTQKVMTLFENLMAQGISGLTMKSSTKMNGYANPKIISQGNKYYQVDNNNNVRGEVDRNGEPLATKAGDLPLSNVFDETGQLFYNPKEGDAGIIYTDLTGSYQRRSMPAKSKPSRNGGTNPATTIPGLYRGSDYLGGPKSPAYDILSKASKKHGQQYNDLLNGHRNLQKVLSGIVLGSKASADMLTASEQKSVANLLRTALRTITNKVRYAESMDELPSENELRAMFLIPEVIRDKNTLNMPALLELLVSVDNFFDNNKSSRMNPDPQRNYGTGSEMMNILMDAADQAAKQPLDGSQITLGVAIDPIGAFWRLVYEVNGKKAGMEESAFINAVKQASSGKEGLKATFAQHPEFKNIIFDLTQGKHSVLKVGAEGFEIAGIDMEKNVLKAKSENFVGSLDVLGIHGLGRENGLRVGSKMLTNVIPTDAMTSLAGRRVMGLLPAKLRAQGFDEPGYNLKQRGKDMDIDSIIAMFSGKVLEYKEFAQLVNHLDYKKMMKAKELVSLMKEFFAENPTQVPVKIHGGQEVVMSVPYSKDATKLRRFLKERGIPEPESIYDWLTDYVPRPDGLNESGYAMHPLNSNSPYSNRSYYRQKKIGAAAIATNKLAELQQMYPTKIGDTDHSFGIRVPYIDHDSETSSRKMIQVSTRDGNNTITGRNAGIETLPIYVDVNPERSNLHVPLVKETAVDLFNNGGFEPDPVRMIAQSLVKDYNNPEMYTDYQRRWIDKVIHEFVNINTGSLDGYKTQNIDRSAFSYFDLENVENNNSQGTFAGKVANLLGKELLSLSRTKSNLDLKVEKRKTMTRAGEPETGITKIGDPEKNVTSELFDAMRQIVGDARRFSTPSRAAHKSLVQLSGETMKDGIAKSAVPLVEMAEVAPAALSAVQTRIARDMTKTPVSEPLGGTPYTVLEMQAMQLDNALNMYVRNDRDAMGNLNNAVNPFFNTMMNHALLQTDGGVYRTRWGIHTRAVMGPHIKPGHAAPGANLAATLAMVSALYKQANMSSYFTNNFSSYGKEQDPSRLGKLTVGYIPMPSTAKQAGDYPIQQNFGIKDFNGYRSLILEESFELSRGEKGPRMRAITPDFFHQGTNFSFEVDMGYDSNEGTKDVIIRIENDFRNSPVTTLKQLTEASSLYDNPNTIEFVKYLKNVVDANIAFLNQNDLHQELLQQSPHGYALFTDHEAMLAYIVGSLVDTMWMHPIYRKGQPPILKDSRISFLGYAPTKEKSVGKFKSNAYTAFAHNLSKLYNESEHHSRVGLLSDEAMNAIAQGIEVKVGDEYKAVTATDIIAGDLMTRPVPIESYFEQLGRKKSLDYVQTLTTKGNRYDRMYQAINEHTNPALTNMAHSAINNKNLTNAELSGQMKSLGYDIERAGAAVVYAPHLAIARMHSEFGGNYMTAMQQDGIVPASLINGAAGAETVQSTASRGFKTLVADYNNAVANKKEGETLRFKIEDASSFTSPKKHIEAQWISRDAKAIANSLHKDGTTLVDVMTNPTAENLKSLTKALVSRWGSIMEVSSQELRQANTLLEGTLDKTKPKSIDVDITATDFYKTQMLDVISEALGTYNTLVDMHHDGSYLYNPSFLSSILEINRMMRQAKKEPFGGLKGNVLNFVDEMTMGSRFRRSNLLVSAEELALPVAHIDAVEGGYSLMFRNWDPHDVVLEYGEMNGFNTASMMFVGKKSVESYLHSYAANKFEQFTTQMTGIKNSYADILAKLGTKSDVEGANLDKIAAKVGDVFGYITEGVVDFNTIVKSTNNRLSNALLVSYKNAKGEDVPVELSRMFLSQQGTESSSVFANISKNILHNLRAKSSEAGKATNIFTRQLEFLGEALGLGPIFEFTPANTQLAEDAIARALFNKYVIHVELNSLASQFYREMDKIADSFANTNSDISSSHYNYLKRELEGLKQFIAQTELFSTNGNYVSNLNFNPLKSIAPQSMEANAQALADKVQDIIANRKDASEMFKQDFDDIISYFDMVGAKDHDIFEIVGAFRRRPEQVRTKMMELFKEAETRRMNGVDVDTGYNSMFGPKMGRALRVNPADIKNHSGDSLLDGVYDPQAALEYFDGFARELAKVLSIAVESKYSNTLKELTARHGSTNYMDPNQDVANPGIKEMFYKFTARMRGDIDYFGNILSPDKYGQGLEAGTPIRLSIIGDDAKKQEARLLVGQYVGFKTGKDGQFVQMYSHATKSVWDVNVNDIAQYEYGLGRTSALQAKGRIARRTFKSIIIGDKELSEVSKFQLKKDEFQAAAGDFLPKSLVWMTHLKGATALAAAVQGAAGAIMFPLSPSTGGVLLGRAAYNATKLLGTGTLTNLSNIGSGVRIALTSLSLKESWKVFKDNFRLADPHGVPSTTFLQEVGYSEMLESLRTDRQSKRKLFEAVSKVFESKDASTAEKLAALNQYQKQNALLDKSFTERMMYSLSKTDKKAVENATLEDYQRTMAFLKGRYGKGKDGILYDVTGDQMQTYVESLKETGKNILVTVAGMSNLLRVTESASQNLAHAAGETIANKQYGSASTSRVAKGIANKVRKTSVGEYERSSHLTHNDEFSRAILTMFHKFNRKNLIHTFSLFDAVTRENDMKAAEAAGLTGIYVDFDNNKVNPLSAKAEMTRYVRNGVALAAPQLLYGLLSTYAGLILSTLGANDDDDETGFIEGVGDIIGAGTKDAIKEAKGYRAGFANYVTGQDNLITSLLPWMADLITYVGVSMWDAGDALSEAFKRGDVQPGVLQKLMDSFSNPNDALGTLSIGVGTTGAIESAVNFALSLASYLMLPSELTQKAAPNHFSYQFGQTMNSLIYQTGLNIPIVGPYAKLAQELVSPMIYAYYKELDEIGLTNTVVEKGPRGAEGTMMNVLTGVTQKDKERAEKDLRGPKRKASAQRKRDKRKEEVEKKKKRNERR